MLLGCMGVVNGLEVVVFGIFGLWASSLFGGRPFLAVLGEFQ